MIARRKQPHGRGAFRRQLAQKLVAQWYSPLGPLLPQQSEASCCRLLVKRGNRRIPLQLDRKNLREKLRQAASAKVVLRVGNEHEAAAGGEHARGFHKECGEPLDVVNDVHSECQSNDAVPAREGPRRIANDEPRSRRTRRCLAEHGLGNVEAGTDNVSTVLGEGARVIPCAAADVQDGGP